MFIKINQIIVFNNKNRRRLKRINYTKKVFRNRCFKINNRINSLNSRFRLCFNQETRSICNLNYSNCRNRIVFFDDYFNNQYQNRLFYNQRFNMSAMQQRVYLIENNSKYYNKEAFQKKSIQLQRRRLLIAKKKQLKKLFSININTNTNMFFTINCCITKLTISLTRLTNQT